METAREAAPLLRTGGKPRNAAFGRPDWAGESFFSRPGLRGAANAKNGQGRDHAPMARAEGPAA